MNKPNLENQFLQEDGIEGLNDLPDNHVHLILSDIPYGICIEEWDVLHQNKNSALLGSSPAQKKAGAIFKKRGKPINGWSEADRKRPKEYEEWCSTWAHKWYRVLKPGGFAFVFAGRQLAHRCICALEDAGFSYKDTLAWIREKAPHRAQRLSLVYKKRRDQKAATEWSGWRIGNLRPAFEPILWFAKPYKRGGTIADNALHYGVGAYNQDAFERLVGRPDNIIRCGYATGEGGLHPTQKPEKLMQILIELTTREEQIVLDPFAGSGTTLIAARHLQRKYLGYEINKIYHENAQKRFGKGGA
ncbi:MAG: site-specific DNA-methyltransferase [Alphaproteobacteria bacterium]|nr:site-specific DNA-methyltransferase [Alphaproteobacteria bacterium]